MDKYFQTFSEKNIACNNNMKTRNNKQNIIPSRKINTTFTLMKTFTDSS